MKVLENITIYKCDYCPKWYQLERFANKHEKYCRLNPNNRHACFDYCQHLVKERGEESGPFGRPCQFKCNKLNKYLHSYIAERIGHPDVESTERMPLKCKHYLSPIV